MWSYFDKIYCINLIERKDRYELSQKVFQKYNIPVTYFRVNRHKNGDEGCFNSHVSICKDAVKNNFSRIIIFEDDIVDTDEMSSKNIRHITRVLKNLPNWDIFYLGCFPDIRHDTFGTRYRDVYSVRAYGAHAYIINFFYIRKIAGLKWENRSYDSYLTDKYNYCYLPRLFDQRAISSDIPRGINFVNSFPYIKKFFLNLNEWYATEIKYSVKTVGLFVCIYFLCFRFLASR